MSLVGRIGPGLALLGLLAGAVGCPRGGTAEPARVEIDWPDAGVSAATPSSEPETPPAAVGDAAAPPAGDAGDAGAAMVPR